MNGKRFLGVIEMAGSNLTILIAVIVVFSMFSGCISGMENKQESGGTTQIQPSTPKEFAFAPKPHVVVALVDSGITPYHEVFLRSDMKLHPSMYIEGYPEKSIALNLTLGNFNLDVDNHLWKNLTEKTLYWFPGTNIIAAISFSKVYHTIFPYSLQPWDTDEEGQYYILDIDAPPGGVTHGTSTSSTVVKNNPDALIVMVQADPKTLPNALEWIANQTWIDVVSLSWGMLLGQPLQEWANVPELTRELHDQGKVVVGAGGNDPIASIHGQISGPPWVISTTGGDWNGKGAITSLTGFDFISNLSVYHADGWTYNSYRVDVGTSLSTPIVSGIISKVILEARKELNYSGGIKNASLIEKGDKRITNDDIRNAINQTARYWNTTEYDPELNSSQSDLWPYQISTPILPVAPFLQMGWGYIGTEIVNETVDILLGRKEWTPSLEKQLAEPYMNAVYELRKTYWENPDWKEQPNCNN